MLSGLAHDPLQRDIFTALWVGGTICIPDAEQFFTPGWLAEWMSEQGITFAHLTPPMARLITETARIGCRMEHLRYAFFVGDKLTRNDVANLKEIAPRVIAINSYGATETQRAVGYYILPPEQDDQRSLPLYPIGCGMPDAQLLILNENGQLAGLGELGEIYVRSPHLALGYLDDPQLTQSRFIINPFTGISTDRLYRTGDLGRYRSDGQVDFQGRRDTQVKIRGFHVEPGEIESALEQHPQVRGAVVVPDTDPSNATTLNAYIVPIEGAQLKPQEIRQYLARGLPEFMLPASYILMAALPLTPNGKVNLKALPEPDPSRDRLQDEFVAPRNPTEKIIARIWSEVLELDQVGIYDNFFDLNGHSLLAIRLINKLDNLFQVQIPLRSIFEAPTVETLATVLRQISGEPEQVDRTAQLILKLAEMSEADAQDLLEDRQADLH